MNFKAWKIKVVFHEVDFDSLSEEKQVKILMEQSLTHLIIDCEFIPRQGDVIGDIEGDGKPFCVEEIILSPYTKVIEFVLSLNDED